MIPMWIEYNPNPCHQRVGDCTIRAISKALGISWEQTYIELAIYGFMYCDIMNSNNLWGKYLKDKGFKREIIPDDKPDDYTVEDFCEEHPKGLYILALQNHVLTVIDGNYYDAWHSGNEIPIYVWTRKEDK